MCEPAVGSRPAGHESHITRQSVVELQPSQATQSQQPGRRAHAEQFHSGRGSCLSPRGHIWLDAQSLLGLPAVAGDVIRATPNRSSWAKRDQRRLLRCSRKARKKPHRSASLDLGELPGARVELGCQSAPTASRAKGLLTRATKHNMKRNRSARPPPNSSCGLGARTLE